MTVSRFLKFGLAIKDSTKRFPTEDEWCVFLQGEFNMTLSEARWIAKRLELCKVPQCHCHCHTLSIDKEEMDWVLGK